MKKFIFLTMLIGLAFVMGLDVLAIGIVSKPLVIENAIRGEIFEDGLDIFNSESSAVIFELTSEGEIEDWVTFFIDSSSEDAITEISAEAKSYARSKVNISVPEDVANGTYEGKLIVTLRPAQEDPSKGSSASVSQQLSRSVTVKVTDNEQISLDVSVIPDTYDVKKSKPVEIRLIYDNQGNVRLSPQIDFKIYAENNELKHNVIYPYPDGEKPIKPGEIREVPGISFNAGDLGNGNYRAVLSFLHGGEEILTENFKFNVKGGSVLGISIGQVTINWWIIGIALLVIIVAVTIVVVKKKSKKLEIRN